MKKDSSKALFSRGLEFCMEIKPQFTKHYRVMSPVDLPGLVAVLSLIFSTFASSYLQLLSTYTEAGATEELMFNFTYF